MRTSGESLRSHTGYLLSNLVAAHADPADRTPLIGSTTNLNTNGW
jgi:hypothetical protein